MRFIADFHIHSKYSRESSAEMDLENLEKWSRIKGIKVIGTGDFTHPLWFKELSSRLEEAETGLFRLRSAQKELSKLKNGFEFNKNVGLQNGDGDVRYILTAQISCLYFKHNAERKIGMLIFAPSLEVVEKINTHLGWVGNLQADGQPTLGIDAKELVNIILKISKKCLLIPTDIWAPEGSIFGSQSGFESLRECFDELTPQIQAIETGLSSDPQMNWRWSALDDITQISNSDAKKPDEIGRQANIFEGRRLDYMAIVEAIKKGAREKRTSLSLVQTLESFPELGPYFFDGHSRCRVKTSPQETSKIKGVCPKCQKPLTLGALYQSLKLADRAGGEGPGKTISFKHIIPLKQILDKIFPASVGAKRIKKQYQELINRFGNEFEILLNVPIKNIEAASLTQIAEAIKRLREGRIKIDPGYDGQYGEINIFSDGEQKKLDKQKSLF